MRYLVRAVIALLGLLLITLLVVTLLRIPLDLSHYKPLVEDRLSEALGRQVAIDGTLVVTTSLWPYFELGGMRIANPPGFPVGDVVVMEQARISIGLPPLLQRRVVIRDFKVSGMTLDLIRKADGDANWVLQTAVAPEDNTGDPNDFPAGGAKPAADFLALDALELADIVVRFRHANADPLEFHLWDATGGAPLGEPMTLDMDGTLLGESFALEVKADSLSDFLKMTRTRLGVGLDIARTRFEFAGLSEALRGGRGTEVSLLVSGADFSSLNDLLRLDLPPLEDYKLKASARFEPGKVELKSLDVAVKNSHLKGHMLFDRTGSKPLATLDLHSERIQLADFDTGDWAPEPAPQSAAESDSEEKEQAETADATDDSRAELLSPQALARVNGRVTVSVDEVLSGEDKLGKAELVMALQDGRLDIDPLRLQLPKSSLQMAASFKPDARASDASLRLVIDNFDFGVLSRLRIPPAKPGARSAWTLISPPRRGERGIFSLAPTVTWT